MKKIECVIILKNKEPEVVKVKNDYKEIIELYKSLLTEEEKENGICLGLENLDLNLDSDDYIAQVGDESALMNYSFNREWNGPCIVCGCDNKGDRTSLSDELIKLIKEKYALDKLPKSKSDYINKFIEKYYSYGRIFTFENGYIFGTANTMIMVNELLKEKDKNVITKFENVFKELEYKKNINPEFQIKNELDDMFENLYKYYLEDLSQSSK